MKRLYSAMAAVAATLAFAACSEIEIESPSADSADQDLEVIENGNMEVTFNCTMEDVEDPVATRTEFHDNTIWWSEGDVIRFYQRYIKTAGGSYSTGYFDKTVNAAQESYSTTLSFTKPAEFPAYYWAIYPSANIVSPRIAVTGQDGLFANVTVPSEQNPTLDSFDPKADVLVSEYIEAAEQQKTFNMRFRRVVALGKMTIKNLPSANNISSIEISCSPHYMAGDGLFGLDNTNFPGVYSGTGSTSLTLIYTESVTANSSDGMTAFFTCLPFTLAAEESFSVKVTTSAGEVFTKNITVPSGREIKFEEGKGTRFNVDMSTAEKTCEWLSLSPYSSGSYVPTIDKTYAGLMGSDIASAKWCTADMTTFNEITDFDTYVESNGTVLSDTGIANLNSNKTQILSKAGTIDTEYAFIVKATNTDGQSVILTTTARTDWFKLGLATRSSGDLQSQFYGAGLDATKTRNYRIVATSALEGIDPEKYYTSTLNPGTSSSLVSNINTKGAAGLFYHEEKYYVDKTTQETVVSGVNYTIMMKVTNTRGETKFCTASADAK